MLTSPNSWVQTGTPMKMVFARKLWAMNTPPRLRGSLRKCAAVMAITRLMRIDTAATRTYFQDASRSSWVMLFRIPVRQLAGTQTFTTNRLKNFLTRPSIQPIFPRK